MKEVLEGGSVLAFIKKQGGVVHLPQCYVLDLIEKDTPNKSFIKEYTKDFSEATFIYADEHSGQIDKDTR